MKICKVIKAKVKPVNFFVTFMPFAVIFSVIAFLVGINSNRLTVLFAGLFMPFGYRDIVFEDLTGIAELKLNSSPKFESTEEITQNQLSYENEKNVFENLTDTPEDVLTLMQQAADSSANLSKDGKIVEQQYTNKKATHVFGNVAVRNTTETQQSLNIKEVLSQKVDLSIKDKSVPTVLIFHTHTTETFEILNSGYYSGASGTRSNDLNKNMVRVGKEIVAQLESAGFAVIHDTEIHDSSYNGSYAHSAVSIAKYKEQYPNLQVIIDVHRDAIQLDNGNRIKPTATINEKKAAQIMIISGCQEQNIIDFEDWQYNLRFALQLQKTCEDMFPGLMRPLLFSPRKYNMNSSHCSVLLEMGSNANTLEEAVYSGRLVGNALASLLENYVEN